MVRTLKDGLKNPAEYVISRKEKGRRIIKIFRPFHTII